MHMAAIATHTQEDTPGRRVKSATVDVSAAGLAAAGLHAYWRGRRLRAASTSLLLPARRPVL